MSSRTGTRVDWFFLPSDVPGTTIFGRVFWAFGPAIEGMDPGPVDDSHLYLQATHRSQSIWDISSTVVLSCRRREAASQRTIPFDQRIAPYLEAAGFLGVSQVGFMQLDWHLITALVERWRPETHTFHMPCGECTITLQDVAVQLGLPVDGEPLTRSLR
uniref:Aminotransferase-like plant mobile domain-containing protein n=1 Tax=Cucumis melo TaxID=3656 RepID=A0A9I9E3X9_CUCME